MAEIAALTAAHAHARKAAEKIEAVHWTEAADEHRNAANSYSRAAKTTGDFEALRILRLLEEQHAKLAKLIKAQDTSEQPASPVDGDKVEDNTITRHDFAQPAAKPLSSTAAPQSAARAKATTSALAAARLGSSMRESSPSLARDIASRRGIPPAGRNPPSAAAQARARQLSPESHRRNRSGPAPKIPPSIMDSQTLTPAQKSRRIQDDNTFEKFYSNLTTGTMSKLSSVLAYAGLPLTADDVKVDQTTQAQPKITKQTVTATNEPDVNKIFSQAALKAIEDDHQQRGHHGRAFGPAESFYVVQTGGGTYSYADIAKAQQAAATLAGIDEDDEEAFVDAREAQTSTSSPTQSRFPAPRSSSSSTSPSSNRKPFGKNKTSEELELENITLKQTLEQLAIRLREFETHAQDASMAALTQSMASVAGHHLGGAPTVSTTDPALTARLRQVEQRLEQKDEEAKKYQSLAAKQEKTLRKYQSKWEEIKQSAKEKQRVKAERGGQGGGGGERVIDEMELETAG